MIDPSVRLAPAGPRVNLYNGPTIPVTYDPDWQLFTNLTPEQVIAFQNMPEGLADYASKVITNKLDVTAITHSSGVVVQPFLNGTGVKFTLPDGDVRNVAAADLAAAYTLYCERWGKLSAALADINNKISRRVVKNRIAVDNALSKVGG